MFYYRHQTDGTAPVAVAVTDSSVDLQEPGPGLAGELARVEAACGVGVARLHQEHGDAVVEVDTSAQGTAATAGADGVVTTSRGVALMVRVADCVPVLMADRTRGVVGAAHSGRKGTVLDVVGRTVERMRRLGADDLVAWVGPHVCGGCYEVPGAMREEVVATVPAAWAETTWGTPSLDLGAGVRAQLDAAGVDTVWTGGCTLEDDQLHSHRRDRAFAGRMGALVWMP